jgi:hypothetical protein
MSEKSNLQLAIDDALRRASLPTDGDAEVGVTLVPTDPPDVGGDDGD